MRILVVSDIHANIDALRAINESFDEVLFLGDAVDYGPDPVSCIGWLRERGATRVRGNHDNAVAFRVDCGCGQAYRHLSVLTRKLMWKLLDQELLDWTGAAQTSLELSSGGRSVFAVHAAPSDHLFKYVAPEVSDEELAEQGNVAGSAIVLMGHTHRPFIRETGGRTYVNVGSVGQPRDSIAAASYAILEDGRAELKRVEYDIEAAVAKLRALPLEKRAVEELVFILENAGMP